MHTAYSVMKADAVGRSEGQPGITAATKQAKAAASWAPPPQRRHLVLWTLD